MLGCQDKGAVKFNSPDITGAQYGRDFELKDPSGKVRTLADFRGKAVMLFFGFTQCPDVCPTALIRAADVKKQLGDKGTQLQVIFITIDPERDTPPVLEQYAKAFDPSFIGLYGDLKETSATAREFKVFYMKVPTGQSYTMDHTAISYVFDPQGRLRLAVSHTTPADKVAADIRALL
ncbi:MAG: SCO family protein [Lautropia sp.]